MKNKVDALGKPLSVGDTILFPVAKKPTDYAYLEKGRIETLCDDFISITWLTHTCRAFRCVQYKDVVKMELPKRMLATPQARLKSKAKKKLYFGVTYELNGDSKTLRDWSEDERCAVLFHILRERVEKLDWDLEKALITPPLKKNGEPR